MNTNRLYYDNAYCTSFDAVVVDTREGCIALNQSAFYPTSGGQPYDTGTILYNGLPIRVNDVTVEDHIVWHHVDSPVPLGATVHGLIDWQRRFDHMQQHAADHMIAGCIWETLRGVTIGLHTGSDVSTIDISMPDGRMHLTDEETRQIENLVNRRIQENHPIRCWFPSEKELAGLPIRKKPTVSDHIRIVAMGDFEMVACGGTHPSTTGQIGVVKILSTAPSRGNMRLSFVAGMRAIHTFQTVSSGMRDVCSLLSADAPSAPAALQKLMESGAAEKKEMQSRLTQAAVSFIAAHEKEINGCRCFICHLPFADNAIMQQAAKVYLQGKNLLLFLTCPRNDGYLVLFGRTADRPENMASLLRQLGVRGGGKPDFAQGSATDDVLSLLPSLL